VTFPAAARRVGRGVAGRGAFLALVLALTFAVTAPLILLAGVDPFAAYAQFLILPLTTRFGLLEVLTSAIPLLFTGAAVALAFRAGYWNIGAEGQLLLGAIAGTAAGMAVTGLPAVAAIPLVIVAGAGAGLLWALVPALLRVRFGIDEVVTTLLLNPVALLVVEGLLNGPWRDPETQFPESQRIAESAQLPALLERSRVHLGFVIALVIAGVLWYAVARTPWGLRLRAVGLAPDAARFAGIGVARTLLAAALLSGAIAGIGGASEIAGIQGRLTGGLSSGFGYTGIVVATLAGLSFPGVVLVALLLGDLSVGAGSAGRSLGIPSQAGDLVQATVLLVAVALIAMRRWGIGPWRSSRGAPATAIAADASLPAAAAAPAEALTEEDRR
jgi:simple sugar transport system permease protein